MKKPILIVALNVLLLTPLSFAQTNETDKIVKVKEELRKLFADLNDAWQKRDRRALERIYADEFVFVHASGYVDDRTTHITEGLTIDVMNALPVPAFDELYVYGDVAVYRQPGRTAVGNSLPYSTAIYAKKDGRWQIVQLQGTLMQPERKIVKVDAKILDSHIGKYQRGSGQSLTITREGDAFSLQFRGIPKRILLPISDSQFFIKIGHEITFYKDETGKTTHLTIRAQNGQTDMWKRVE